MSTPRFSLLVLKTHHVERLKEFYETIGIIFHQEQHGKGPAHFAGSVGDVLLEIYPLMETEKPDTTTRLGFVVDDLHSTIELLNQKGMTQDSTVKETPWGKRCVTADTDGRKVEIYEGVVQTKDIQSS